MEEIKKLMGLANESADISEKIVKMAKDNQWNVNAFSSAIKTIHNLILEKENGK